MQSTNMKEALTYQQNILDSTKGSCMRALFSDVGDMSKTSDKLMFALLSVKFPGQYDEAS